MPESATAAGGRPGDAGGGASLLLWFVTLAIGAAAMAAGGYGWWLEENAAGRWNGNWNDWVDVLVRAVKSLLLSDIYFDGTEPGAALWLETSRALGVVFSLLVAGRLIVFAAGSRLAGFMLRFRSGHDVVIGSGPAAREYAMAAGKRRITLVASTLRSAPGRIASLRRSGSLRHQLADAGAGHARRILVDEGDDQDTWQTAQAAAKANRGKDVLAYISDPWVLERLDRADPESGLHAFSYAGGVARQVLLAHPPYLLARKFNAPAQHILIVGFGAVGQAVAREFLVTSVAANPERMMITAIDPLMGRLAREFSARHPALADHVDIALLEGDLRVDDAAVEEALAKRMSVAAVCAVYVAVNEASLPLSVGVALKDRAERLGLFRAPIFLCAEHGAGDTPVYHGVGMTGGGNEDDARRDSLLHDLRITSFGSWSAALDGSGLLEDKIDDHPRQLHEGYRKHMAQAGAPAAGPANGPWETLADRYRIANRRTAAHIRAKLDAAGFNLDKWLRDAKGGRASHELPPGAEEMESLSTEKLDTLGALEHRRWMLDRLLNGWSYGPVRDDRARVHPDLKPGRELDEAAKEKDRANVRKAAEIVRNLVKKKR
jgi:voltage-gated potassium channel Kch